MLARLSSAYTPLTGVFIVVVEGSKPPRSTMRITMGQAALVISHTSTQVLQILVVVVCPRRPK